MSINNFISEVKFEGLARQNRFAVLFNPPVNIGTPDLQKVLLFCDTSQLPGVNFSTVQNRTYGEFREIPYEKLYDKNWSVIDIITINNENHFKNIIRCIIKINKQNKNYNNNIYNLIILEINKLKEKNKKYYDNFICPITLAVMKDPVICSDAHTYERSAIEKWLYTNNHSPITREKITNNILIPNIALRNIIQEFKKDNTIYF
jgi:hypothetical protein